MAQMSAHRAGGVMRQSFAGPPLARRPDGTRDEAAATIGADIVQHGVDAIGAERTLIAADTGIGRVGRQVDIAAFAIGSEFEHGLLLAGMLVARIGFG
ncbi:MAG: hypothetical protein BGO98_27595 [Myxococcales bacterium 68-20]|nr:MAG: hypothetical protein BGO98_27595 [Myxococcales bacterium 68-20]